MHLLEMLVLQNTQGYSNSFFPRADVCVLAERA